MQPGAHDLPDGEYFGTGEVGQAAAGAVRYRLDEAIGDELDVNGLEAEVERQQQDGRAGGGDQDALEEGGELGGAQDGVGHTGFSEEFLDGDLCAVVDIGHT